MLAVLLLGAIALDAAAPAAAASLDGVCAEDEGEFAATAAIAAVDSADAVDVVDFVRWTPATRVEGAAGTLRSAGDFAGLSPGDVVDLVLECRTGRLWATDVVAIDPD